MRLYADSKQARALLGFAPEVSLSEGLTRLRDWYLASGVDPRELLRQEITHNWEAREARR